MRTPWFGCNRPGLEQFEGVATEQKAITFEASRSRRSGAEKVRLLKLLRPGESCILRYEGKTQFGVWIAIQRQRFSQPYRWKLLSDREYEVSLGMDGIDSTLEKKATGTCPAAVSEIDWNKGFLNEEERKAVIWALDAYRYSPRSGADGGLLSKTARAVGSTRQKVHHALKRMTERAESVPWSRKDPYWDWLSELVRRIASSRWVWLHEEMDASLERGETVEYACNARDLQTFLRCLRRRGYEVEVQTNPCKSRGYWLRLFEE